MSKRKIIELERCDFRGVPTSLRSKSVVVCQFDENFRRDLHDLTETFESEEIAVGLAAPQIGLLIRTCVINIAKKKGGSHLILVNPEITYRSREMVERYESCMSLPHFRGKVSRPKSIEVSYEGPSGERQTIRATDFLARVILHEIDHLDGVLYVDHITDLNDLEPVDFFSKKTTK